MSGPDPRTALVRDGLATTALEGLMSAARYANPLRMACMASAAAIRTTPDFAAGQESELLFGEAFDVLAQSDGWAFGQARRDGYVGYVEAALLGRPTDPPTHWVSALTSLAFARPDVRGPTGLCLPMNAVVTAAAVEGRFARVDGLGFVPAAHLSPLGQVAVEPAAVAEAYLGAPYLWGGRRSVGVDCSGLVQAALQACGRACPRDSDLQQQVFRPVENLAPIRGDLVFWPGHVGMLLDAERLLHASAEAMGVIVEPFRAFCARRGEPTARRRP